MPEDNDAPRPNAAAVESPTLGVAEPPDSGDDALRAVLVRGAACPHCRYDLAGLGEQDSLPSACPECGTGLEAGLVGRTGPRRLLHLMTLMFAWLAFAGTMNATRAAVQVHEFYLSPQWARLNTGTFVQTRNGFGGGWSAIPLRMWLDAGGWSALALLGVGGAVATAIGRATPRGEKRLFGLLVLGFVAYWGYHGVLFVSEMLARL